MTRFSGTSMFVIALALAACGGGGGGAAINTVVPPQTLLSSTTNFKPQVDSSSIVATTDAKDNVTGLTLNLKNDAGTTDIVFTGLVSQTPITLADIVAGFNNLGTANADEGDGKTDYRAQAQEYEVWGVWGTLTPGATSGGYGAFVGGNETEPANMPTTAKATYNGTMAGLGANATEQFGFTGTATVQADFAAPSVTTTFSGFTTENVAGGAGPAIGTLSGGGAITGNAYTTVLSGGGLNGTASGKFFGPAAQETAGVFGASGGGTSLLGSFGATSVPPVAGQAFVPPFVNSPFNASTVSATIKH